MSEQPTPALFEAAETEAGGDAGEVSRGTHLFLGVCIAGLVAFIVWSALMELDVVSTASGEVAPSTNVKTVQHLEGGIVAGILVHEGDLVSQGQPLVELEAISSGADVGELEVRIDALAVEIARLEAEIGDAEAPAFPPEMAERRPDMVAKATRMFETRRQRMQSQVRAQQEAIEQRQHEIREVQSRRANAERSLELIDEQIAISEKLLQRDLTNRMLHLNLLKEQADLRSRIDESRSAVPRLQAAAAEARSNLSSIRASFREEAEKELDEALRNSRELTERLAKYRDSLARTVLRAPVDGVVKTLHVVTTGGVIQPGEPVVDIVPRGDRLIVDAQLPTQDIGYVQAGQPVKVSLASADAARFGNLAGTVLNVSPDTLTTEDGVPYYKVRITTPRDYFEDGNLRYNLFPGMQVVCAIQTGSRTVLEYILDPLIGRMDDALRER
jgi:membrane fusion protein, adhesin transport system